MEAGEEKFLPEKGGKINRLGSIPGVVASAFSSSRRGGRGAATSVELWGQELGEDWIVLARDGETPSTVAYPESGADIESNVFWILQAPWDGQKEVGE